MHRRSAAWVGSALIFFVAFWKLQLYDPAIELDPASRDTYAQLYPMWVRAAESLRAGTLPLWNPYQACGQPFLPALLYGVLYPMHLAWLVLDPAVVLELSTIVHLFAAWLFTYLFCRACGLSRAASSVAGVAFALSGVLLHEGIWYAPAIDSAVWLPLGLFALEKLIREASWRWVALIAIAVAMPIFAGWLQNFLYFAQALALYGGVRVIGLLLRRSSWRSAATTTAMAASGVVLGLALSAVQLLPSLELARQGTRGSGALSVGAMFPFPAPAPSQLLAEAFDARPGPPRLPYVGVVPLVLLPAALWTRRRAGPAIALTVLALFGLLATMTLYTPLWDWYLALPGVALFRIPWRVVLIYAFAGSALSGFAFDNLLREQSPGRRRAMIAACGAAVLVALAAVDMPALSRVYLVAGLALLALSGVLSAAGPRRAASSMLALLIAVELFLATRSATLHPIRDLSMYEKEDELFAFLRANQGFDRTYVHAVLPAGLEVTPKIATLARFFSIANYENLSLERHSFFFAGMDPTVRQLGYYPLPFDGGLNVEPSTDNLRMMSLLSVRFVGVLKGDAAYRQVLEGADWRLAFISPSDSFVAYENPRLVPRAYVSRDYVALDASQALATVWRPRFNPFRSVVIEPPAGEQFADVVTRDRIVPAKITLYEPTRVVVEAKTRWPGMLVLTDTHYPGWRAWVDGVESEILAANYLFRGVPLTAGHHTVVFAYSPSSLRYGAAISLVALLICGAMVARPRIRRGRSKLIGR